TLRPRRSAGRRRPSTMLGTVAWHETPFRTPRGGDRHQILACERFQVFNSRILVERLGLPLGGPPAGRSGAVQRLDVSAGALRPPPISRKTNLLASFDSTFPASGGPSSWVKLSTSLT